MRNTLWSTLAAATLLAGASGTNGQEAALAGEASRGIRRPTVIVRPGVYLVERDFSVAAGEVGISVEANNVTLDLGGHTLTGPGGRNGRGIVVSGVSNVRVRNGHLSRFGVGVLAERAGNLQVEDLQIDGLDSGGAPPDVEIAIMLVDTRGARIERNTITDTFLGIFVRGAESGGNRISANLITGGDHGELGICYNPAPDQSAGGPHGDLVYQNVVSRFRRGIALSADSTGNVVRENTLAYFDLAVDEATAGSNLVEDNDQVEIQP